MIVFNQNETPILIVTRWHEDPEGGPGHPETTFMIGPGHEIELDAIGLVPARPLVPLSVVQQLERELNESETRRHLLEKRQASN